MYRVISKNRANNETEIVASDIRGQPLTKEKADAFAIRCTMAESNPKVIYTVK